MGAERSWDIWACAGQDGFIVQEQSEVIRGECEVEDEGTRILSCELVALIPFPRVSDTGS